ncbi:MAG: amidohydrolase family protein [Burkholderiaceae bacterium]|jgi:cytosine deaminase|nr:amidohydrolase family protein [Burkholderiales bacterium]MCZ8103476.1 amidohydrolase family protein [Burkholderiales bacterium]MCZ8337846.1 amidohydrolase family protein [Burkholderiaceae bacterium]
MFDLIVRHATLPDGRTDIDVAVRGDRIAAVEPHATLAAAAAGREIDAGGLLLSPPFVDAHFHMDATLSLGLPRFNQSGTLLEGIALWGELKPHLRQEALVERALAYCDIAVARGLLAVRSHVDTSDPRLLAVDALLEVKRRVAPYLDLQLVAFPQDGVLRYDPRRDDPSCTLSALQLLEKALDKGVDVVGGIPHFERTMADGLESVRLLCELAASRGLRVDMHCDESDDPLSRHVETLALHARRLGLQGRVTGSHLTSMHSMDNYYVSKLIPLIAEAGLSAIANPLINITLQGRHDTYPKRRGMTRVPELMAAGVPVAFGHDCVMDPWYPMGSGDMLEVASMALHVAQMTGRAAMRACYDAVTGTPARILGLEGYGLAPGCFADLVLLQARDPIEAIRLRPARLAVLRRGRVVSEQPPATAALRLDGRPARVDFLHRR